MPEVQYTTTMSLDRTLIWEFVKDMNNWAPFLTGYQRHEIVNETDSIWELKGDVGVLARLVKLKAHITEWQGPERVSFTLLGLNEPVDGGGTLTMSPCTDAPAAAPLVRAGFFRRVLDSVVRFLFRLVNGKGPERANDAGRTGAPVSQLTFTLRMDAGGPTGLLVNAMLGPALMPAAEDLANKIAAHLEKTHARA